MEQIRKDIRDFRVFHKLDQVIVLWTANTERFCDVLSGLNNTAENLLSAIKADAKEVSPSTLFAVACILEEVRTDFFFLQQSHFLLCLQPNILITSLFVMCYLPVCMT
jgi:myo-inositol-1-phosphate synthase